MHGSFFETRQWSVGAIPGNWEGLQGGLKDVEMNDTGKKVTKCTSYQRIVVASPDYSGFKAIEFFLKNNLFRSYVRMNPL